MRFEGYEERHDLFSDLVREAHDRPTTVTLDDIIILPAFQTSTFLFRAEALRPLPDWFTDIPAGDWGLFALVASCGPIRILPDVLSVYRRHDGSVTHDLENGARLRQALWHRESFTTIARQFQDAARTRRWRKAAIENGIHIDVGRGSYVPAIAKLLYMSMFYDHRLLGRLIRKPGKYVRLARRSRGDPID